MKPALVFPRLGI